jgi:hypothetical protein
MKKITIICMLFGLLILLALAVTSCPKTGDLKPGQGTVVTKPVGPPVSEREAEVPSDAAATPEELDKAKANEEAKKAAEGGEKAGGDEGAAPEEGSGEDNGSAKDDGEDTGEETTK